MKYTIKFNKKTSEKLYDKVYKTLDLVFGYALGGYVLTDGEKLKSYVLESEDDAECELDRILEDVNEIFDTCLQYDAEEEEEDDED
jgi:hypothetical protein